MTITGGDEQEPRPADESALAKLVEHLAREWNERGAASAPSDRLREAPDEAGQVGRTWLSARNYVAHLAAAPDPGAEVSLRVLSRYISSAAANVDAAFVDDQMRVWLMQVKRAEPAAVSDDADHDVSKLVAEAARHGLLGLPLYQLLLVIFVVLLAAGLPFVQVELPSHVQSLMTDEEATTSIGVAIALGILHARKKP